ncbi:hypothetical protein B0H14DRAFT_2967263 [Mycena olivaceomarginata]|nr:hypothetical protein B0H14DRAFT_2967263 [Mycena olivaceomarginata]
MDWNQCSNPPSTSVSSSYCATSPNSWPTGGQVTKEVLHSVLRIRKIRKTSREGETVWPLDLEAALLEGLEVYQPVDSRETRMLGRFPRRNRFISDYIFDKTGIRRSPKQVGSRLQQLRESCEGTQLLRLLSPFRKPLCSASPASVDNFLNSSISPLGDELSPTTPSSRHTVICIDILPKGSTDRSHSPIPLPWADAEDVIYASDHPRRLESINPTVAFTASRPVSAYSRFTVYSEDLFLHCETVPLLLLRDPIDQSSSFLYSTQLVPKWWNVIVDSPDPTRFVIFQEVLDDAKSSILFFAMYKFRYPRLPVFSPRPSYDNRLRGDIIPYTRPDLLPNIPHPTYDNAAGNSRLFQPDQKSIIHRCTGQHGDM